MDVLLPNRQLQAVLSLSYSKISAITKETISSKDTLHDYLINNFAPKDKAMLKVNFLSNKYLF